ncbi:hypothetical protein KC316_g10495 [Hortaea werneckii]|nr:hypothetical protein KC324_g10414 [Hortaea werneckii]KAI7576906.1 hypothetical protein KC316_g10495 [Hortaea werneckii]
MVMLAMGQKHQRSYGTRSTQKSTTETPRPTRGASGKERGGDLELPHPYPYGMRSIQQPPSSVRTAAAPQALCLTIETSNESFLPTTDRSGRSSSDKKAKNDKALKVEIFVNGQLAGVSFVNRRGSAVEYSNNKVRFQGTRIHRQSEKPWIYTGSAKMQVGQDGDYDTNDSLFVEEASKGNERWTKINAALEEEASARGRNDAGEMPPSAEFLQALSGLKVPQSVAGNEGIGIIDVIVTVGTGKKYGPEHGYLSEPSRMDDNTYSTLNPAPGPVANDFTFLSQDAEDASPLFDPGNRGITSAYTGYPITPAHRRRDSGASVGDTPSKKTKTTPAELAKKFGLEGVDLKQMLDGYETSMGKAGVPKRNLSQRLTDLAKMNPKNQEKQLAVLKEQLAEGIVERAPMEAEENVDGDRGQNAEENAGGNAEDNVEDNADGNAEDNAGGNAEDNAGGNAGGNADGNADGNSGGNGGGNSEGNDGGNAGDDAGDDAGDATDDDAGDDAGENAEDAAEGNAGDNAPGNADGNAGFDGRTISAMPQSDQNTRPIQGLVAAGPMSREERDTIIAGGMVPVYPASFYTNPDVHSSLLRQARLNMAQAAGLNSNSRLHQRIVSNTPASSSHQGGGMMQGFGSGPTAYGPYNHPAQATAPTASTHASYGYPGQGTAPTGSANVRYSYQGPGVMSTMPAQRSYNYPGQGTAPNASAGIPLVYQYQGPGLMSTMPGHRSYNNSGQGTAPTASTYGSKKPLKQDIEPPIRYLHYTKYGPPIWVTQGDMKPPPEDDVDQDQGTASGVSTYGSNTWLNQGTASGVSTYGSNTWLNQDTEDEDNEPTLPAYAPNNTSVESFGEMSANAPESHLAQAFEDSPVVVADNRPVEGDGDATATPAGNHPFLGFGGLPFITAHNRPDQAVVDPSAITADDDPAKAPEWGFDGAGDLKTTRASALAGAGCRVPVKPQRKAKKKAFRPSAHLRNETLIYGNGDDAFPIDPALMATRAVLTTENTNSSASPAPEDNTTNQQNEIRGGTNNTSGSRSVNPFGLGSNRTRNAWNPNEKSPQKTLEEYQVPELSRGSCVSYAQDPKVQRQVGKARNGEFKEEGVVWGVRFLVI